MVSVVFVHGWFSREENQGLSWRSLSMSWVIFSGVLPLMSASMTTEINLDSSLGSFSAVSSLLAIQVMAFWYVIRMFGGLSEVIGFPGRKIVVISVVWLNCCFSSGWLWFEVADDYVSFFLG